MTEYEVDFVTTFSWIDTVYVEAESKEEARKKVKSTYYKSLGWYGYNKKRAMPAVEVLNVFGDDDDE